MTDDIRENKPAHAAYLLTEDGLIYKGHAFGFIPKDSERDNIIIGELVYTTAMTGYTDTLTDPSYYGQIVIQAFPLIGNYGIVRPDFESEVPALSAYIVREYCQAPSNFRSEGTLDIFLCNHKIPGIAGIDTRALIRRVRDKGTMNGIITYKIPDLQEYTQILESFKIKNAVASVSGKSARTYTPESPDPSLKTGYKIALWDFGAKGNIIPSLLGKGCEVVEISSDSTAGDILNHDFDGLVLSNGPGDPQENTGIIKELSKIIDSGLPVFGICLGHQLAALAMGAKTEKLRYGHRGANQPVKRLSDGRMFITSQNHGYAVISDSLPQDAEISFININDGSCEGVEYKDKPVLSVQFYPETCDGSRDTGYLFDKFISIIDNKRRNDNA